MRENFPTALLLCYCLCALKWDARRSLPLYLKEYKHNLLLLMVLLCMFSLPCAYDYTCGVGAFSLPNGYACACVYVGHSKAGLKLNFGLIILVQSE